MFNYHMTDKRGLLLGHVGAKLALEGRLFLALVLLVPPQGAILFIAFATYVTSVT